jgi:beta-1,2-mannosidase
LEALVTNAATFPLGPFEPHAANPILRPRGQGWESANVNNPAAIVVNDTVVLLYRANGPDQISRIGIATSRDGITFDREPQPVLVPTEPYEAHGCEDPRVTGIGGTYYLTYTGFDGHSALLCLATSTDLHTWTKHGPLFPHFNTWANLPHGAKKPWSKAGVICPEPIGGLYYLYFGEGELFYATSTDLLHWTPCDNASPIYSPTPGSWDATVVEIGSPPVITANGLMVFLINSAIAVTFSEVHYRGGQFAIAMSNPTQVLAKQLHPWLVPQWRDGANGSACNATFVEGLVNFRGQWLAYYGQSDATLAVAVFNPETQSYRAS